MNKGLSIIIPVYNGEKYISRCLTSILLQNFDDYEIIIIDDGSIDQTATIINRIIEENSQKKIVYHYQENQGVARARNKGIELSHSKYIMFIDHDDYIEENFLFNLYTYARENDVDLLRSGYQFVNQEGKIIKEESYGAQHTIFLEKDYHLFLETTFLGYVGGLFIKREIVADEKFDDQLKFAEDLDFILRCYGKVKKMAYYAQNGYFYFQNEESATKSKNIAIRIKEIEDNIEVFSKFIHYQIKEEEVANILYIRIHMKLKYILQNCHISYSQFLEIITHISQHPKFILYQEKYWFSKMNIDFKDKLFMKFLLQKKYRSYYYLNRLYQAVKFIVK